ncbi:hypothetical protein D7231_31925 [Streptomyces klenkii]|uniref:Uncharacterized protein n=1 Tax=Streptomyces klenkii TaxID=1420899 RepID=A0A3B0AMW5_9ACTN|nr:hypothetical protein [Streptomyces klenkii]RKN61883.1 hypothetical protein D7231_31925 [Streptomyces klenkii]
MTTCPCCPPDHPRTLRDTDPRHACTPCLARMTGWLAELPNQMTVLRASLHPERAAQFVNRRAGHAEAPIPGRLDVLSLAGPAAPADGIRDPYGQAAADQHGPLPVAATLAAWARLVAEERGLRGPAGRPGPEQLGAWLTPHLPWCADQPWVAELHGELRVMMRAVRDITRVRPRTRPVPAPCPRCDALALVEADWQTYRECVACGSLWTAAELADAAREWAARRAAA